MNKRSFCTAKAFHTFSTKNIGIFDILTLTNDVVCFEQPGPDLHYRFSFWEFCLTVIFYAYAVLFQFHIVSYMQNLTRVVISYEIYDASLRRVS